MTGMMVKLREDLVERGDYPPLVYAWGKLMGRAVGSLDAAYVRIDWEEVYESN